MDSLVLNGTEIRVDEHGRYCLTDLWKAGGSVPKDKPSQFTKQDSCKNLVNYLNERNRSFKSLLTTRGKYTGGTWALKHVVYAYAMWISPKFQVKVIDVFDSASSGNGDKAVAIAQGNEELKALVDKRDNLIYTALTQSERDEIERLTSEISKHVRPSAQNLQMMRGKGKKYAEYELSRINASLQLDMFSGSLR